MFLTNHFLECLLLVLIDCLLGHLPVNKNVELNPTDNIPSYIKSSSTILYMIVMPSSKDTE